MTTKIIESVEATERDYVIVRKISAPRGLVYKAWTEPTLLAMWWGPRSFTAPVSRLDVRPGGDYRLVIRSPEGVEYPMKGEYREVVEPERLVFSQDLSEHPAEWHTLVNKNRPGAGGNLIQGIVTTVTFAPQGVRTRLTIRMNFNSKEDRDALVQLGMNEGWSQSLDRLEELLASDRTILSSRVFPVPRERMWQAWSDPAHLAAWWGPKDFSNTFEEFDFRPGGTWKFIMHGPGGVDYPNKSVFAEIVKPERIVFNHLSEPRFRVTATFGDKAGQTEVVFRMLFESSKECAKLKAMVVDANEQNFDRLAAQLAKMT